MALPAHASPGEKVWHYCYLTICGLVFLFLIAPIIIIIPLSFNAEPYFTFTQEMLSFDPKGYSLRWYDRILTHGMANPDIPRDGVWWNDAWNNGQWIHSAKNSVIIGVASTLVATVLGTIAALGLSRPEMPFRRLIMALLISPMIVPLIITATGLS
ncbi:MAG: ABC transporter permease, partial [Proteobacteria bacterium]|nr:ABC transporter permease [Pseudomonadota bacterium]